MTSQIISTAGASSVGFTSWESIDWKSVNKQVRRLQMRIAKAMRENRRGKVKSLQWLLTHSFCAKLLAVKQVSYNRGSKTAGVDNVIWQTPNKKMKAAKSLKRRGYEADPLRRIYIPKRNGNQRPLGIPTMKDRAMQALYLLALAPISETTADKNSYGFRSKRSTADAIEQCFKVLAQKQSAPWILEADIRSCFDQISHEWLMNNILIDKTVLKQWLAAGYMEKQTLMPTREGTPQGGIISPTLANITLDGLEETVINAVPKLRSKAHVVRYADDFIVTGASKELLEHKVKPAIQVFLERRGLMLSQEKTKITHISDGFNFLGFNIRKYANGKLLIKPSKGSILTFLRRIRIVIKKKATANTKQLISQLNPKLRGWAYYYRHVVAKQVFSMIDHNIFKALYNWIKRRHPRKSQRWRRNKYFRSKELRNWVFSTKIRQESGKLKYLDLFKLGYLAIIRHRKVKAEATPFDPAYKKYFEERKLLSMKCSPFHWVMHNKAQLAKAKYWIVQ